MQPICDRGRQIQSLRAFRQAELEADAEGNDHRSNDSSKTLEKEARGLRAQEQFAFSDRRMCEKSANMAQDRRKMALRGAGEGQT